MGSISASPEGLDGHRTTIFDFLYLVLGSGSLILSVVLWKIGQGIIAGPLGIFARYSCHSMSANIPFSPCCTSHSG